MTYLYLCTKAAKRLILAGLNCGINDESSFCGAQLSWVALLKGRGLFAPLQRLQVGCPTGYVLVTSS